MSWDDGATTTWKADDGGFTDNNFKTDGNFDAAPAGDSFDAPAGDGFSGGGDGGDDTCRM